MRTRFSRFILSSGFLCVCVDVWIIAPDTIRGASPIPLLLLLLLLLVLYYFLVRTHTHTHTSIVAGRQAGTGIPLEILKRYVFVHCVCGLCAVPALSASDRKSINKSRWCRRACDSWPLWFEQQQQQQQQQLLFPDTAPSLVSIYCNITY